MSIPTEQKLMIRALKGGTLERPPYWLMRQAGRYLPEYRELRKTAPNFLDFCYNPDLAVEVTLQPLRRYHMDAAILFSDILVIPDALGQNVQFFEGEGPVLDAIQSLDDIKKLNPENITGHLSPVFEILKRLRAEIPEETALIGFAGSPWTIAVYMIEGRGGTDHSKVLDWADNRTENFQVLMDMLVDATSEYLVRQVESGAEIIQLFDSWAGVLNKEQFQRWSIEPTRRIVAQLRDRCPGVPVIGFPRNAGPLTKDYVAKTGVDGVSLDQDMSLEWIAETLQPMCTVQGNLDNQVLITGGKELDQATIKILSALSGGPFIFNLGHGVSPSTPPEHVAELAAHVRSWSPQPRSIPFGEQTQNDTKKKSPKK